MNVIELSRDDLKAILFWYNKAYDIKRDRSELEMIPYENTLIKIRAILLTVTERDKDDKRFWSKFGGR